MVQRYRGLLQRRRDGSVAFLGTRAQYEALLRRLGVKPGEAPAPAPAPPEPVPVAPRAPVEEPEVPMALRPYLDEEGRLDLVRAAKAGVDPTLLRRAGVQGPALERYQALLQVRRYLSEDGNLDLARAVKEGVSEEVLVRLGIPRTRIRNLVLAFRHRARTEEILRPYRDEQGRLDLVKALEEGVPVQVLKEAGVSERDLERAGRLVRARKVLAPYIRDGKVDLLKALEEGVPESVLKDAVGEDALEKAKVVRRAWEKVRPYLKDGRLPLSALTRIHLTEEEARSLGLAPKDLERARERAQALEELASYRRPDGTYDIVKALEEGKEEALLRAGFDPERLKEVKEAVRERRSLLEAVRPYLDAEGRVDLVRALREGVDRKVLERLGVSRETIRRAEQALRDLEAVRPYLDEQGQVDLARALKGGVSREVLERLGVPRRVLEEAEKGLKAWERVRPYIREGALDLLSALKAGVPEEALVAVGVSRKAIRSARDFLRLEERLRPFTDEEGRVDLVGALRAGVPEEDLRRLFGGLEVGRAKMALRALRKLEPHLQAGLSPAVAVAKAGLTEAEKRALGIGREVVERGRALLRLEPYRQEDGSYDIGRALREGVSRAVLRRAGFSEEDIRKAEEAIRRARERAGEAVRRTGVDWTATLKEVGLDLIPIYGTARQVRRLVRDWDRMDWKEKALATGGAALSALGDASIVLGGLGLAARFLGVAGKAGKGAVLRLPVKTAQEAVGFSRASRALGKAKLVVRPEADRTYLREVGKLSRLLRERPSLARRLPVEVEVVQSARIPVEQLRALPTTLSLLRRAGVRPRVVVSLTRPASRTDINAIANAIGNALVKAGRKGLRPGVDYTLTIRAVGRDIPTRLPKEVAKALGIKRPKAFLKALRKAHPDPRKVDRTARRLAKEVKEGFEGQVPVRVEEMRVSPTGPTPVRIRERHIVLEPPKRTPSPAREGPSSLLDLPEPPSRKAPEGPPAPRRPAGQRPMRGEGPPAPKTEAPRVETRAPETPRTAPAQVREAVVQAVQSVPEVQVATLPSLGRAPVVVVDLGQAIEQALEGRTQAQERVRARPEGEIALAVATAVPTPAPTRVPVPEPVRVGRAKVDTGVRFRVSPALEVQPLLLEEVEPGRARARPRVSVEERLREVPREGERPEPEVRAEVSPKAERKVRAGVKVETRQEEKPEEERLTIREGLGRGIPFKPGADGEEARRVVLAPKDGQWPRKVGWRQGVVYWTLDLASGQRRASRRPPPGVPRRGTPLETLRVLQWDRKPPAVRAFRLGAVQVAVAPSPDIGFRAGPVRRRRGIRYGPIEVVPTASGTLVRRVRGARGRRARRRK